MLGVREVVYWLAFAWHLADLGSILSTQYGLLSSARKNP